MFQVSPHTSLTKGKSKIFCSTFVCCFFGRGEGEREQEAIFTHHQRYQRNFTTSEVKAFSPGFSHANKFVDLFPDFQRKDAVSQKKPDETSQPVTRTSRALFRWLIGEGAKKERIRFFWGGVGPTYFLSKISNLPANSTVSFTFLFII